jgi:HSP20 family protein
MARTERSNVMPNIVKKEASHATEWDPFRTMREWMKWDPFREIAPVYPAFESTFTPSFEVTENTDAYLFKADVPGVKPADLEITIAGNRLQIAGKRDYEHETRSDTVYLYERQYGKFTRSFTLPDGADLENAKSELVDGVLTLAVPKKPFAQAKKIAVTSTVKS